MTQFLSMIVFPGLPSLRSKTGSVILAKEVQEKLSWKKSTILMTQFLSMNIHMRTQSPGKTIMEKIDDIDDTVSFDEHPHANPESRKNSLKRFQMNPEANWGPKMRSKTSTLKNMEN